jgi:hypothetical protein
VPADKDDVVMFNAVGVADAAAPIDRVTFPVAVLPLLREPAEFESVTLTPKE